MAGVGSAVLGIPLALAAFMAGLAIAESDVAIEARQRLLPFRDLFAVLFFVAVGTLIDPALLWRDPSWLVLLLALLVLTKSVVVWATARLARLPVRPVQLAVGLSQVGEFSFVLAAAARALGAIDDRVYVAMLAAVAVSIAGSTIAVRLVGRRTLVAPEQGAMAP